MDREGIGKRTIKGGFNFMKRKRITFLAMLMLAVILLMPASIQAAAKPGAVKLTKITAVDYNKINIKWKKSSDTTSYIVYYKEARNSKWIKLKTLGSTRSSYTHTSSKKYPIIVGQKYQYTVKAYNRDTKKYGSYNTKGLTVTASLKMVTGIEAKIEGTTVKLTWNKVSGADKYAIYSKIKAGDKWSKIITVKDTSSFVDVNPCVNCTNYYSVRGYSSSTKTYGVMNKTGVSIYVKDSDEVRPTITPEPTDTPDPDDEVDHATPEQKAQEVFKLVNTERMKAGLQPYKYDLRLEKAAMVRAKEIAVKFSHERPDGTSCGTAVTQAGAGSPTDENIGMGTSSAAEVMKAWMDSLGHKIAILSKNNTHIGVGYYKGHWVQTFSDNPDKKCTFTINANGGVFSDGTSIKFFVIQHIFNRFSKEKILFSDISSRNLFRLRSECSSSLEN
jgi:uncharacterized protein YkwD